MPISDRVTDDAATMVMAPFGDGLADGVREYRTVVAERVHMVRERIARARARSPYQQAVTLIAVTKTHGADAVDAAVAAGLRDVGENRVQEAQGKRAQTTTSVTWHLIGHLQRNKAALAVATFDLVQSVDSVRLAEALDLGGQAAGRVVDVLVQTNVSGEASKGGFAPHEIDAASDRLHRFTHLRVCGAMTMAPFDAPTPTLRDVFTGARAVRDQLANLGHPSTILSMGMSDDFEVAIEEGATHVRLGTILFGHRS